ncbi:hypothetical protein GJ631_10660 [Natronomonas sp. CBA1123]|uniref:homing endonuclease associated repeat-containing protein n=1 Tax=Natronomonas sp. CBA1123 TaxID=2668070 RepID=UPI0012EA0244|nr:HNH endonuclease [Natronomonas sp. CBA1123]MUV87015.1 hypothetical protein [Natronomonas sp. CBA1123]
MAQKIPRDTLIEALRDLADELGETPTSVEMADKGEYAYSTYGKRFGSWSEALHAADLDPTTPQQLTVECDTCGTELDRPPCRVENTEHQFCSQDCQYSHDAIGNPEAGREQQYSDEELLSELESFAEELGRTPTRREFKEYASYSVSTLSRRFGTWNSTLRKVGLEPNNKELRTVQCANCSSTIRRRPDILEQTEHNFCDQKCMDQFNSFETNCANCGQSLRRPMHKEGCFERYFCDNDCKSEWQSENLIGESSPLWKGGPAQYGKGWNEAKKREVRSRDGYECQSCGMDQTEHIDVYGRKLDVHHIVPARQFDTDDASKNDSDNLVTLCQRCHSEWEGVPLRPQLAD